MQELSLAQSVLDTVKQNVAEEDLWRVRSITMRIGDSSVKEDCLDGWLSKSGRAFGRS